MDKRQAPTTRSGVYRATGHLIDGLVLAASPDEILAAASPAYDPAASATTGTTARLRIAIATSEMVTELETAAAEAGIGADVPWVLADEVPYVQAVMTPSRAEPLPSLVEEWPPTQPLVVVCRHLLGGGAPPRGHVQIIDGGTTMTLLCSLIRLGLISWGEL